MCLGSAFLPNGKQLALPRLEGFDALRGIMKCFTHWFHVFQVLISR